MSASQMTGELVSRLLGLSRLWSITKGSSDICVAILDGPVDAEAVAQPEVAPAGVVEHGTHVYSILAGWGDGLVPGLAPGCRFVSVPIFDAAATAGRHACSQHDLAAGIRKTLDAGANILNVSASQQADLLSLSTELSAALQEAVGRDALVVAAAGNQGCACDTIPASVAGVLAVGAHDKDGSPLLSSNWGPNQRSHGVTPRGATFPAPASAAGSVARRGRASRPRWFLAWRHCS